MRNIFGAVALMLPAAASAQTAVRPASDTALARRILVAEDRRDATDPALAAGRASQDPLVRTLALRATSRIADKAYAGRDSLPPLPRPVTWPEPAWRLRYRALAAPKGDCSKLETAMADSAWAVRLHAVDLADSTCAGNAALLTTVRTWIDKLPTDASRRAAGGVSWHAAAHGIVALARLQPGEARTRLPKLSAHAQWQVRAYAARAAAVLHDSTTLRRLAVDRHDNVRDVAITALAKLTGHADDALYLATIGNPAIGAQAGRAAAAALKGSPRADVASAASAAFDRWAGKNIASARDVRLALLDAAGRPATDDRPPASRSSVPANAVALAMGAPIRLRVTIAPASGRGSFVVLLRGDVAPLMAARIDQAVHHGYYRGLTWHRVEPDFVIQGGSPAANEYVGSREFLRDELGTVPHLRGTVGMSTRGHDTGDYQWFVNLKDNLRLNADYTIFGEVTEGIDIVDGILEGDVIQSIEESPEGHD